uniref:Uncharacterized protein n=1 Tax=Aegilops tauschii subsp. strangulata TaxID=200361 RepID=A0A453NLB6_AEGTS
MAALSVPLRTAAALSSSGAGSRAAADPSKVSCVRSKGSAHFGCSFPSIAASSSSARNIEPLRAIATQAPPAVPRKLLGSANIAASSGI